MTRDEILRAFERMRVWQRGDQRAVHKPLLVLYALARVGAGGTATIDWNDAEPHLKALLEEFGPDGSGHTRHHPFWHLQTDGLWQLEGPASILTRPPAACRRTCRPRHRCRNKLAAVIRPFARKCCSPINTAAASSGHDLRLGRQTIGREAAHIKWFQARGPDVVPNGIALCSLHHKVFDLGAFTILPASYQMVFSQHLNGSDESAGRILVYHGASLILPQSREYLPQPEFLDWHKSRYSRVRSAR